MAHYSLCLIVTGSPLSLKQLLNDLNKHLRELELLEQS